ncbi:hypothetical protein RND81_04G186000 [Saponaria officinalis]|uniref:Glycosyltransferase n=1 Tax=Saponaria officinalis TaxID=3572 RepID=A0AAW1LMR6_SAPOF
MAANQNPTQMHFLLLSLPHQGHTNPTLEFANQLLEAGSLVTLATTCPCNRLMDESQLPTGLSWAVFSADGGLQEDSLAAIFSQNAAQGHPVTHMVHTNLLAWAVHVATRFNVPSTLLWIYSATVLVIYYHYFNGHCEVIQNCEKNPSWSLKLPNFPFELKTQDLPAYLLPSSPYAPGALPRFRQQIEELIKDDKPKKVLVNTTDALESDILRSSLLGKFQLIPVGPLFPSNKYCDDDYHIKWLNSQEKSSVIYVSFGSFWMPSKEQMKEMAQALILTERPFLWVVRNNNNNEEEDYLASFKDKLKNHGIIVPWCSQLKVLSHPSVGCFLTHCGWNSILESISVGIPMVAFPQSSDQMTNAKMIEDVWKVGVRVEVGEGGGLVKSQEIKRCLDLVMDDQLVKQSVMRLSNLVLNDVNKCGISKDNIKAFIDHTNITSEGSLG